MKMSKSEKNLTENVMGEIYQLEKNNLLKTLTFRLLAIIFVVSVFIYLLWKGLQAMSENGDTALIELILMDGELIREFLLSELMYLMGVFDNGLYLGIIMTMILFSILLIMSWKSKKYLMNKWKALNRLKSRLN